MAYLTQTVVLLVACSCVVFAQNATSNTTDPVIPSNNTITNGTTEAVQTNASDIITTAVPMSSSVTELPQTIGNVTVANSTTVSPANTTLAPNSSTPAPEPTTTPGGGAATIVSSVVLLFAAVILCCV